MNCKEIDYWSDFYSTVDIPKTNSNFSNFVINFLKNEIIHNLLNKKFNDLICLDCGCGNGRDSYYMSKYFKVTGVDNSICPQESLNCDFYKTDFCTLKKDGFDVIYSRFTFHSITNEQQLEFIKSLVNGQILCIETRSDLGNTDFREHGDNHYRNYTNKVQFINLLNKYNFDILYLSETNDVAIYKKENPICIRLIAIKK